MQKYTACLFLDILPGIQLLTSEQQIAIQLTVYFFYEVVVSDLLNLQVSLLFIEI